MRQALDNYLARLSHPDIYLVHGDMWHFTAFADKCTDKVINCGIQEPTVTNIAAGLAWCGKTVFVYGVSGMIIHRAYEQIKLNIKGWAEDRGRIIFINAGHNNCYEPAGRGHMIDDDVQLCHALKLPVHTPETISDFLKIISECLRQERGVNFIRLGWDNAPWR